VLLYRCPASYHTTDIADAVLAYQSIESCGWPAEGGMAEQTCAFMQATRVLGAERAEIERENAKDRG
jgi:hypothetical protein